MMTLFCCHNLKAEMKQILIIFHKSINLCSNILFSQSPCLSNLLTYCSQYSALNLSDLFLCHSSNMLVVWFHKLDTPLIYLRHIQDLFRHVPDMVQTCLHMYVHVLGKISTFLSTTVVTQ